MTIRKLVAVLVSTLFMMAMLGACGQAPPVTLDKIALPPNVAPLPAGDNSPADLVADSYRKSVEQQNVKVDVQMYTLPNGIVNLTVDNRLWHHWQHEHTLSHSHLCWLSLWSRDY